MILEVQFFNSFVADLKFRSYTSKDVAYILLDR